MYFFFSKYPPLVDNEHVGKIRSPMFGQDGAYYIMFIVDNVVYSSFQVLYCDNKES